jgi:hypothetical protein
MIPVVLAGLLGATDASAQSSPRPAATGQPSTNAEPIKDTRRFAEHTGLFRVSTLVGSGVKDLDGKYAGRIEHLPLDHRGHAG